MWPFIKKRPKEVDLMVTLWPSFPHFPLFAEDSRLWGIRLNSAMVSNPELERDLGLMGSLDKTKVPLLFDVKGRQLRITDVHLNPDHLDITMNHPVSVKTPVVVLFKAGEDYAILDKVTEDGYRYF